jgi:hypothetical protein
MASAEAANSMPPTTVITDPMLASVAPRFGTSRHTAVQRAIVARP